MIEIARHSSRQKLRQPAGEIAILRWASALTARTNLDRSSSSFLAFSGPSMPEKAFHASSQHLMSPVDRPASQQRKPTPTSLSGARAGRGTIFADGVRSFAVAGRTWSVMTDLHAKLDDL